MTEAEIAAELGVSVDDVRAMRERGCPAQRAGKDWKYDLADVRDWLVLAATAARRAREGETPQAKIQQEEARRKAALADRYEHEVAVLRERYVLRSEVEEGQLRRIAAVRAALDALPDRLDGLTPDQRAQVAAECRRVCEEFASG